MDPLDLNTVDTQRILAKIGILAIQVDLLRERELALLAALNVRDEPKADAPPPGWSDKDVRMYKHIKSSSGSKSIAAATVNKFRAKHKKSKKRRR